MLTVAVKMTLIAAVALLGVPHAFCAGHVTDASHTMLGMTNHAPACEHGSGDHQQSPSRSGDHQTCSYCSLHEQPYAPAAKAEAPQESQQRADLVWPAVAPLVGILGAVIRPDSPAPVPVGHFSGSGCALPILLGRLLF